MITRRQCALQFMEARSFSLDDRGGREDEHSHEL